MAEEAAVVPQTAVQETLRKNSEETMLQLFAVCIVTTVMLLNGTLTAYAQQSGTGGPWPVSYTHLTLPTKA